jgi:nucleolar GTP-binding protein
MNILYDRDHYKLALGQIASARHSIDKVGKEYIKLIKYGDSLYRCKSLKRSALGRMATVIKRQKESLAYLEQVRQHMARLPSIDTSGRTLLLCGYPNVGKSSFMNCVTRAEVDVQPYAFTTKSLFVGHMDYKYLRWQVIDTPGLLDHPLEDRNTIEMQSITALAHLRACVLYFIDLSGQCGYTLDQQLRLFTSLKPLFAGKPVVAVTTKSDIMTLSELSESDRDLVSRFRREHAMPEWMSLSALQEEGVMAVRNAACDMLLEMRVSMKMGSGTGATSSLLGRLHQAMPKARDDKMRAPCIPAAVLARQKESTSGEGAMEEDRGSITADASAEGTRFETDFNRGLQDRKRYLLQDAVWAEDVVPEISAGKNIADYIDVDIMSKLAALEEEEHEYEMRGHYQDGVLGGDEALEAMKAEVVRERALANLKNRLKRSAGGKGAMVSRTETMKRKRRRPSKRLHAGPEFDGGDEDAMSGQQSDLTSRPTANRPLSLRAKLSERSRSRVVERSYKGLGRLDTPSGTLATTHGATIPSYVSERSDRAVQLARLAQKSRNRDGKAGEADRHHVTKMPKHLFAGKRKNGTHDRR